ncbi:MAG: hypothetical protein AB1482_11105 [Pseudomonadota bacterium]
MSSVKARGVIVTVNDVRAAKLCTQGAREWFSRHGLDWAGFLAAGLPDAAILATGDAMAERAVIAAHIREAAHGK